MRADKLQFNIAYKNFEYTENASKLRVFCYMKNGGYAFGDEFSDLTSATFDSTRTAKYSGYGTITIQLIDDEENLINSANVVCKIIESNSTTPFVASPDFAQESKREIQAIVDNGKDQIVIATKKAKEEIDNWSDQLQRLADTESNIASLQMFKANTGALHFTSGSYAMCSQNVGLPKVFSLCRTFAFTEADWNAIKGLSSGYFDYNYFNVTIEGTGYNGYALRNNGGDLVFYVSYNSVIAISMVISNAIIKTYLDGKEHRLCVCSNGSNVKLYIDGVLLKSATGNLQDVATGRSAFTYRPIGKYMDIYHFNFDISLADALYTLTDYQQGKPIPPNITQGIGFAIADNFGAGGWTDGATSSGNWYKGNYVKYIANHTIDNIDTEAGITEAVDLSTSQTVGATLADVCLYNKSFSFKNHAGKRVRIKGSYKVRPLIDLGSNNAPVVSIGVARNAWGGYVQLNALPYNQWSTIVFDDYIDVPTTDAVYFGIGAKYDSTTQPVVAIADINIKVVETILALEDYTIANGTSQIVFDYSGNNNDATITGNVKGDNDNRVQKLIDFIKS